jgi:hypothetical protein
MKKIISFILGSLVALTMSITVANAAAKEVRVAYFLEWPSPNLEDMQKKKRLLKLLEYLSNGLTSQMVEQ